MKLGKLSEITGRWLKDNCDWLNKSGYGCCSIAYASNVTFNFAVAVGWHDDGDGWKLAWKIGRQSVRNCMQSDLDIDFEMPYNRDTGDVDDTEEIIELTAESKMKDWNKLATYIRQTARRVWKDWREDEWPY